MITQLMMDVDGVLVTGRPSDGLPWKTDLEADLGVSPEDLHEAFFRPYWSDIVTGKRALHAVLGNVLTDIAPHLSSSELIDYWFANDARLEESVLEAMENLRKPGMQVYLATNQDTLRAQYLWDDLGLKVYADGMLSSARLSAAKPDPEFFMRASNHTNAPVSEHLLIDDSQANTAAAKAAGWHAYHWTGAEALGDVVQRFQSG